MNVCTAKPVKVTKKKVKTKERSLESLKMYFYVRIFKHKYKSNKAGMEYGMNKAKRIFDKQKRLRFPNMQKLKAFILVDSSR
jgi:hypothetical protein